MSCSPSSPIGHAARAGRVALQTAGDLATLLDPLHLLTYPARPVASWPASVLPAATPAASALRGRAADADLRHSDIRPEEPPRDAGPDILAEDFHSSLPAVRPISSPSLTRAAADPVPAHGISPIRTCSADDLTDTLMPVEGGNIALARAMMPATAWLCFKSSPAPWQVSRLRTHLDEGEWQQAADRLPHHSPQRAVALTLAACATAPKAGQYNRETKGGPAAPMESVIVTPSATTPQGGTPLASQAFPRLAASTAIGSTYHAATPGALMNCQDGIYLSQHATVVTDGLGGHGPGSAGPVRVAQAMTGRLVTQLIEVIARTEPRPGTFLARHAETLLALLDEAVASALVAPYPEQERDKNFGTVMARSAFVAVAHLHDSTVAFGVGDCTAHLFAREHDGKLRVVRFTPEQKRVDKGEVGGLGDRTLLDAQVQVRPFPPGHVVRVIAGSDGMFDAHQGHLRLVDGQTPSSQDGPAQVGKSELAEQPVEEACDNLVTRLTQRTRQFWEAQAGAPRPDTTGLDDFALVVRDLTPPAPAGSQRKEAKGSKG